MKNQEEVMQSVIKGLARKALSASLISALLISTFANVAQAAGSNLIANPSLENSAVAGVPDNWNVGGWGNNTRTLTYPVTGHTGQGASATITNYVDGDAKWFFNPVKVNSGTKYVFSDYYNSNISSQLDAAFTMSDGSTSYLYLADLPSSNGAWQQTTQSFTVPANVSSVTIFHLIAGNGTLTVDDYSLAEETTSTGGTGIANPSLENSAVAGLPDNWNVGGWGNNTRTITYPVACHNGVGASATIYNYVNGDAKWFFDPVKVTPGAKYVFSDFYKSTIPSELDAVFTMSDGSTSYAYLAAIPSSNGAWQQTTQSFTVPMNS